MRQHLPLAMAPSSRQRITLAAERIRNLFSGYRHVCRLPQNAYRCLAYLRQIGDYELPLPGIEAELILHGRSQHGLLGLDILKHWTIKFDGPNRFFIISKSNQE